MRRIKLLRALAYAVPFVIAFTACKKESNEVSPVAKTNRLDAISKDPAAFGYHLMTTADNVSFRLVEEKYNTGRIIEKLSKDFIVYLNDSSQNVFIERQVNLSTEIGARGSGRWKIASDQCVCAGTIKDIPYNLLTDECPDECFSGAGLINLDVVGSGELHGIRGCSYGGSNMIAVDYGEFGIRGTGLHGEDYYQIWYQYAPEVFEGWLEEI